MLEGVNSNSCEIYRLETNSDMCVIKTASASVLTIKILVPQG